MSGDFDPGTESEIERVAAKVAARLVQEIAPALSRTQQHAQDGTSALRAEVQALASKVSDQSAEMGRLAGAMHELGGRLDDLEDAKSLETARQEAADEVRAQLEAKSVWPQVKRTLIGWGIPAAIMAAWWALSQWVAAQ